LYIGGSYQYIYSSTSRNGLSSIDLNTQVLSSWDPAESASKIKTMALNGSNLIVGGFFKMIKSVDSNGNTIPDTTLYNLVSFNRGTGIINSWAPQVSGSINTIHARGDILFIGGDFTYVDTQYRNSLSAISLSTGARVGPW
jgi:hypothetical protein